MPLKSDSPVPVFIVHWNRPCECLRTVQCFLSQNLPLSISVIDNASRLDNFQTLREQLPPNIELLRLEENKGWGGGLNVLLRRWLESNSGDYCVISAHDALPQNECLKMLLESMQNDPQIGITCPEYGEPVIPKFSPLRNVHFLPVTPRSSSTIEPIIIPHGTLMVFHKPCLKEIGLFDERYFAYGDEYDIGLRAWHRNWKVAIVWGAVVVNPGTWTPSSVMSYLFARNSLLLAHTYGGWKNSTLRMILMFLNTGRLLLKPSKQGTAFSVAARMLAIRDFLTGQYGAPPSRLQK